MEFMTGQSAEAEEAGAKGGQPPIFNINRNKSASLHRWQRQQLSNNNLLNVQPLYDGPPPRIDWDGTSSIAPPANALNKSHYSLPLLIEPPAAPPTIPEVLQTIEAENHAYRVSHGLCWQEENELEPFEESFFKFGDVDLPPEAVWTSDQKYQFIELLGRRSEANLASIARTIGKPLIDCELYLTMLKSGAQETSVDVDDIPMAEEVDEEDLERTIAENEDHDIGAIDDDPDSVLSLQVLEVLMDHSFSSDSVPALMNALKQKLRVWIQRIDQMGLFNILRFYLVEELLEPTPEKMLCLNRLDEQFRLLQPPEPGTGPLPFDSELGEDGIILTDSESEDL